MVCCVLVLLLRDIERGLDQVDQLSLEYHEKISARGRYFLNMRANDITSITAGSTGSDDRNIFIARVGYVYRLAENWDADASYRYSYRKFKKQSADDKAPHSNAIFLGIKYNFPTFTAM